jgi:hypothetical protein
MPISEVVKAALPHAAPQGSKAPSGPLFAMPDNIKPKLKELVTV